MLEKVSKEKHRLRASSDRICSSVGSLSRTSSANVASNYSDFTDTHQGKCGGGELKETERSRVMEWDSMSDLSTGSDYMLYSKKASRKAKKKWKNHRKKVIGTNFSDMMDIGLNKIKDQDRASIVRTHLALTDASVKISDSIQTSSFETTDSFVIKSVFPESEISVCSSEVQLSTRKTASSFSTPSAEKPTDLNSRSITGGTNKTSLDKDLFQFQSDDDRPVSSKKHKSKSTMLKSPSGDHITNFTMQNKSFSGWSGRRSLRVQLTDIASLMLDKKLKVYKPYESPITSLKSKLDLTCDNVEKKTSEAIQGHVENQEKISNDSNKKQHHLNIERTESSSRKHSKIIGGNEIGSMSELARKFYEKDDSREVRIKSSSSNENVSSLDSILNADLAKKSVNSTNGNVSTNDNSFPFIVDGMSENNMTDDAQSVGKVTCDGKDPQKSLEKPDASRSSTSDKPSLVENQNNRFSRMEKLSHCEAEANTENRVESGSSKRIKAAGGTIFATNSLNSEETVSKRHTQSVADIAPIVIKELNETVATNEDCQDATHKRKRSEKFGSLQLDITSHSQKKPFLKSHAGDCESPIRTRDNEDSMNMQSCSSKYIVNDVWKEASSRLKALINDSLKKSTNKSESSSFSNESGSISESIGNHDHSVREDALGTSRSRGHSVLLKQNFLKNDADLISRLLPSNYCKHIEAVFGYFLLNQFLPIFL